MHNPFGGSFVAFGIGLAAYMITTHSKAAAEHRYAVKELPNLPGGECNPTAINNRGHVVAIPTIIRTTWVSIGVKKEGPLRFSRTGTVIVTLNA